MSLNISYEVMEDTDKLKSFIRSLSHMHQKGLKEARLPVNPLPPLQTERRLPPLRTLGTLRENRNIRMKDLKLTADPEIALNKTEIARNTTREKLKISIQSKIRLLRTRKSESPTPINKF